MFDHDKWKVGCDKGNVYLQMVIFTHFFSLDKKILTVCKQVIKKTFSCPLTLFPYQCLQK